MTKTMTKETSNLKLNIKDLQKLAEEAGYNLVKTPTLPILKEKVKRELLRYILSSSSHYNTYSHKVEVSNSSIFKHALEENIEELYEILTFYEKYTEEYKNSLLTKETYLTRKTNIIKHIKETIFKGAYTYNIPLKLLPETFILYLSNVTGIKPITLYNFSIHTEIISDITSPLCNIPYTLKYLEEIKKRKEEFINSIFSKTPKTKEEHLKRDIITNKSINFLRNIFSSLKFPETIENTTNYTSKFFIENYFYAYSFIYSPEKKEEYFNNTSYINYFYLSPTQTPIPRIKGLEYNIREISSDYRNPSYTITLEELRDFNTYSPILRKCETIHRQIQREFEKKYMQGENK